MSAVGSILTNTGALQALNSISNTSASTTGLQSQLASGLSINTPADNPAGYITAQGFTSQLNGLTQAISNANQGVSLLQTAQGAITQQIGIVQQLNSISVQAANGTQTPAESQSLQNLVGQLTGQVSTIANQTQFNNINLLSGSFSGVQFQVGANEGQTATLSISNLTASAIGMNASTVSGATIYGTNVKATSAALTKATTAQIASGAGGAFTVATTAATELNITGANGGTANVATNTKQESAASLAAAINNVSGTTGVQAQATTSITLALGTAGTNGGYSFAIQSGKGSGGTNGSGIGTKQTITASSAAQMVSQINGQSSTSGIVASLTSTTGQIQLSQTAGYNINITGASSGSLKTLGGTASVIKSGASASAVVQGQVQFQSSGAFSVAHASNIGLANKSTLTALSSINVSTTAGANTAINVVKYALGALNNQGGQLGAVQQALTANINNMNTTSQNLNTALGVVQDANIPAVSNKLTESQIQAQAGVAALKSSTQLQQSYLSLLP
ncbi:flagellin [Acidocella sp.]|uniref:flagellin N-terminal helical domain-containing protein n=1 Tax=Acidocella sp. TaxID=50710 RepID=UPI00260D0989|nr:flagellin [Acidocella sp.]